MRRNRALLGIVFLLSLEGVASGQRPAKQPGPAQREAAVKRKPDCAMILLRAHPATLKRRLGLADAQISQMIPLRTEFRAQAVKMRGEIEQLQLQLSEALSAKMPDEAKVLELERKMRDAFGSMVEEGTKAYFKLLAILTPAQRAKLQDQCSPMGGWRMHGPRAGHPWGEPR